MPLDALFKLELASNVAPKDVFDAAVESETMVCKEATIRA